jgi:ribosomal protein S18 acetylase RimI-like enzyme
MAEHPRERPRWIFGTRSAARPSSSPIVFDKREMSPPEPETALRYADSPQQLAAVEPLWNALQEHHSRITPNLGGNAPKRELADAWPRRRAKYERWLEDPETFFLVAEDAGQPVGYAFVTIGPGYASWATGERLAELETLSVLPEHRGAGIGTALIAAVWDRLDELDVHDLAVTTAVTNVDSHRLYERSGFTQGFVIYYAQRNDRFS